MFSASTFLRRAATFRRPALPSVLLPRTKTHIHIGPTSSSVAEQAPPKSTEWNSLLINYIKYPTEAASLKTADEIWEKKTHDAMQRLVQQPPANAYSGRSVKVFHGNVGDAYKRLDGILARNKVRAQLRLAERHEKKGAKRRRLSSERWRKQFAHEVRKKVQLVTKIRNRGA